MGVKRSRSDSVSSSEDPATPFTREDSADVKIVHLDIETAVSEKSAVMKCSLPPHQPLTFESFEEYDVHYQKMHMNRCSECYKNFPDEHFLSLHIAENHDPIRAAKRDRGEKMYACLIPDCERLLSTPQKRRLHCIDKHQFPRNYDFFIVNDGIDRRSSMLRPPHRRRSSTVNSTSESRQRESVASVGGGERMDVVKDELEEASEEEESKRAPLKLFGRGGFGRGRGVGRGHGRGMTSTPASTSTTKTTATTEPLDPMEGLTSSMSALHFIPHSVRAARGRGRGRVD